MDSGRIMKDAIAGLTVSIISLPMALAFGMASGLGAEAGLYAAIVGGFMAALFGGNIYQVSGPTPPTAIAIATLAAVSPHYAYASIFLAGIILIVFGLFKIGELIRFTPYPLIMGFLTGISLLIFKEVIMEAVHLPAYESLLIIATTLLVFALKAVDRRIPALIISLIVMSFIVWAAGLDVETIGQVSLALKMPVVPISLAELQNVLPSAFLLAVIISMDSLLTTVIVDRIKGTKSPANRELIGQGIGNIFSPMFGGIASSGSDIPTLANIKAGSVSRLSSALSRIFLLLLVVFFSPWLSYIAKPALSGLLVYIGIEIIDYKYISGWKKIPVEDLLVFITVAILTVTVSLITAVGIGFVLASFLFLKKIAEKPVERVLLSDHFPESKKQEMRQYENDIAVYQINAPLFFGSSRILSSSAKDVKGVKVVVIKMYPVTSMDESGAVALREAIQEIMKKNIKVVLTGVRKDIMGMIEDYGIAEMVGRENIIFNPRKAMERAVEMVGE